ncbi:hypothetical protein SAMN04487895_101536 [Paenibacillus sophorae]|uniref:Uncharacterized protein n=1 Tax=Paenibacillus sophorae TaxID=1333845 RepID=A0A1H8GJP5_9BACL|nr:hypothetical protein SAMN04487895_101536 [Paenibacillus sophorae]
MKRKANIRIINKNTGRENKLLTYKFMKAMDSYDNIALPENFKISIG